MADASLHKQPTIFGIRHHGPGSARALVDALHSLQPDIVLIEGPADATELLPWLGHDEMEPPVALIMYRVDQPNRASFFPFALFSPEYQAVQYALEQKIAARFMDLPQSVMLAADAKVAAPAMDALQEIAEIAGHRTHEAWWNTLVEQRASDGSVFQAIFELMSVVRTQAEQAVDANAATTDVPASALRLGKQREAFMRTAIRQAYADGYRRVAVVCGAWHGPALAELDRSEQDDALLAPLAQTEVDGAWAPWTYGRLSMASGYGSGIHSPGWYHHLWTTQAGDTPSINVSIGWLSKVSHLLRTQGFDASSAHVIESVRLAEALAAMRGLSLPGLPELMEATQTVVCFGDTAPLALIRKELIVSERMGFVPSDSPMLPLQRDVQRLQRQYRLRPEAEKSTLALDLRQELHRNRSVFLHRLRLLDVPWGRPLPVRNRGGTFREIWSLLWQPELTVRIIEAAMWGNTVVVAAAAKAHETALRADSLAELTELLDRVLLADLSDTIEPLMQRIQDEAARQSDLGHMIRALPPLVNVLRYGSVRQTDMGAIRHVVEGLLARIYVGLPGACASLNDEAAAQMEEQLSIVDGIVATVRDADLRSRWHAVLRKLMMAPAIHGLVGGCACRLLVNARSLEMTEARRLLERTLSDATLSGQHVDRLLQAAYWIEGFLKGNGLVLVHDRALWELLDDWILQIPADRFTDVLPLLRKTFATYEEGLRNQLGDRVRSAQTAAATHIVNEFDHDAAQAVLPLVAKLLGVSLHVAAVEKES